MLKIAIYISNHGFGHASRAAALAEELIRFGIYCYIRTDRPAFIFDKLDPHYYEVGETAVDFGVKHTINLVPQLDETKEQLLRLMNRRPEIVEREVLFLREKQIDLVIADIPFIITEACKYAKVPVFAISNFDWVFIYQNLFKEDRDLRPLINCIYGLYQLVDHAIRLPFSSVKSMIAFPKAEKMGLLARKKSSYNDFRARQGIDPKEKILLCMFGGEGVPEFNLDQLCPAFEGRVISTNPEVKSSNHITVKRDDDFLDLIHAADVILTKPGYSTFAEVVQFGKFILYFERENYPEEQVLVAGLKNYYPKQQVQAVNLKQRQWKELFKGIERDVSFPRTPFINQNKAIAQRIIERYFEFKQYKTLRSVLDVGTNNLNYILMSDTSILHSVHAHTGLGIGYKDNKIAKASMDRAKKAISTILEVDKKISHCTNILGTSISREAKNSAKLSEWIAKRYKHSFQIISEQDEIKYNHLAVQASIPNVKEYLAFDIGGGSTEFFNEKAEGISIPLGLMKLKNMYDYHEDRVSAINLAIDKALTIPAIPISIIGIGLTVTYLAMIVQKKIKWDKAIHNTCIKRQELMKIRDSILKADATEYLPYMYEPWNLDILLLSIDFIILILDKNHASEFIVCEYGISLGYNYAKKKSKDKRHRNR